jgi:hypothetical protein
MRRVTFSFLARYYSSLCFARSISQPSRPGFAQFFSSQFPCHASYFSSHTFHRHYSHPLHSHHSRSSVSISFPSHPSLHAKHTNGYLIDRNSHCKLEERVKLPHKRHIRRSKVSGFFSPYYSYHSWLHSKLDYIDTYNQEQAVPATKKTKNAHITRIT